MSPSRIDTEVLVIGDGAAGIAAARAAVEHGAKVTLVSEGPGATAMGTGAVWGAAAEPFGQWSVGGPFQRGGRYVTLGAWVVADVVGALDSALDVSRVAPNAVLGVVDLPTHPGWNPRMIASALGAAVIPLLDAPDDDSFHATARRFDTPGVVEATALTLQNFLHGKGIGAVLFPPVLGLRRDDVAARLSAALGVPVGEALGDPGDPLSMRFHRALRQWVPAAVTAVRGRATVTPGRSPDVSVNSARARARAVVLATGGLTGGGVQFGDRLREATADLALWHRHTLLPAHAGALRGEDPGIWFSDAHPRVLDVGLRSNERAQLLGPDGVTVAAPWLFGAGEVLRARMGGGIAGALASGALAGAEAARYVRAG